MPQTPVNACHATFPETSVTMVGPIRTSSANDAGSVALDDLSRFEGEGGSQAPLPDLVDVPLDNAIWRRPRWVASQANQKRVTP